MEICWPELLSRKNFQVHFCQSQKLFVTKNHHMDDQSYEAKKAETGSGDYSFSAQPK